MKKRLAPFLIVLFLILAGEDWYSGRMRGFVVPTKPLASVASTTPNATLPFVTRIIDGDTVVIMIEGIPEKVRLIGVDTPETVDPRKTVQCFGKEASAFTRSLLENKNVELKAGPTQGDRDKYGRLLRYVYLLDGTLVNKEIIARGYGHEYTYRLPYQHQTDFRNAERSARESQKGLWANNACIVTNTL
ncbi:MAG: thermonuclease family protein [bacterium]|nr:thermonuclease family protein [bacterium]